MAESGSAVTLRVSGLPLGTFDGVDYEELSVELAPGDILGLISDGIYEYENEQGVQFGQAGVAGVIDRLPDAGADAVVAEIMRAVREHGGNTPQADDITIVLARRLR